MSCQEVEPTVGVLERFAYQEAHNISLLMQPLGPERKGLAQAFQLIASKWACTESGLQAESVRMS
jgi:hypothetical protein